MCLQSSYFTTTTTAEQDFSESDCHVGRGRASSASCSTFLETSLFYKGLRLAVNVAIVLVVFLPAVKMAECFDAVRRCAVAVMRTWASSLTQ